jgi:(p)ppGpp synthase/HD superfamily hydrolase
VTRIAQNYPQLAVQLTRAGWSSADLTSVREAYDLAATLFVARERGSAKPFIDHLVGTASGVLLGGGDAVQVAAALLHAVYDQGDFGDGHTGMRPAHRRRVAATVGGPVEDLVHRYHDLGWTFEVASKAVATIGDADPRAEAVLLIRVANEVDDAIDGGLVLSGKQHLEVHSTEMRTIAVQLAEHVGTAAFATVARDVLLGEPFTFPSALILGNVVSRTRTPESRSRRLSLMVARAQARARRVAARLAHR